MKNLLILLLLWPFLVCGQVEKSVTSIQPMASTARAGATYAVVVGISDYQNIPDLQYADKDAEAFADFLRSRAGGSLGQQHLVLLTNKNATGGKVAAALDDLLELVKKGDRVIFYFSGHGDVEIKTIFQSGYLLCWDSPTKAYKGNGGTYTLSDLQSFTNTLSSKIQAKVIIILDSCHAGKLSGNLIGGAHLTAEYEDRQFSNEVKILACSSKEFSLEGPQWGGGRGCFSYHLIEGLYGLADKNGDAFVSVSEIDRYLEDHVIPEAAPYSQNPSVYAGERTDYLSTVDPAILKQLKQYKRGELPQFAPAEGRVFEETFLAGLPPIGLEMKVDSGVWGIYHKFSLALKEKRFLEPVDDCAERYFQQLHTIEALTPLHGFIKRNYAAALQDEAQQAVNDILQINLQELTKSNLERAKLYRTFPILLARAAELLGPNHYIYRSLKARQLLFEGLFLFLDSYSSRDTESGKPIMEIYRQALEWQPESPITHYYRSVCYAVKMNRPDSAIIEAQYANRYAETWVIPYAHLAYNLSRYYKRYPDAKAALDKAMVIDSNSVAVWTGLGAVYHYQRQFKEAASAYLRALELDSTNALTWANLGVEFIQLEQYEAAETDLKQALILNPNQVFARYVLGCLYTLIEKPVEAEGIFLEALKINPGHTASRDSLAHIYLSQEKWKDAEVQFLELIKYNPAYPSAWYQLACLAASDGRQKQALDYLENALQKGEKNLELIQTEPRLAPIRRSGRYLALIQKFFP